MYSQLVYAVPQIPGSRIDLLVHTSQTQVLRYMISMPSIQQESLLRCMDNMFSADVENDERALEQRQSLLKYVFRLATQCDGKARNQVQLRCLNYALSEPRIDQSDNIQLFLSVTSKVDNQEDYALANQIAYDLLQRLGDSTFDKKEALLHRLSILTTKFGTADSWPIVANEPAPTLKDNLLTAMADALTTLKSTNKDDIPQSLLVISSQLNACAFDAVATAREMDTLLKSIAAICNIVVTAVAQGGVIEGPRHMTESVLSSLLKVHDSKQGEETMILKVGPKVIQTWLAAHHARRHPLSSLPRFLDSFRRCLIFARAHALDDLLSAMGIHMYNTGGYFYAESKYKEAASCLELCAAEHLVSFDDHRKCEFLWSAYLFLKENGMAHKWLISSLQLLCESTEKKTTAHQALTDLQTAHGDLIRVIGKLVQLTERNNELKFPVPRKLSMRPVVLELRLCYMVEHGCNKISQSEIKEAYTAALDYYAQSVLHFDTLRLRTVFLRYCIATKIEELAISLDEPTDVEQLVDRTNLAYCSLETRYQLYKAQLATSWTPQLSSAYEHLETMIRSDAKLKQSTIQDVAEVLIAVLEWAASQDRCVDVLTIGWTICKAVSVQGTLSMEAQIRVETLMAEASIDAGFCSLAGPYIQRLSRLQSSEASTDVEVTLLKCSQAVSLRQFDRIPETVAPLLSSSISKTLSKSQNTRLLSHVARYMASQGKIARAVNIELEVSRDLRRKLQKIIKKHDKDAESTVDSLIDDMRGMSLHPLHDTVRGELALCSYRLSSFYEQAGFIREALYHAEESSRFAQASGVHKVILLVDSHVAALKGRAGKQVDSTQTTTQSCQSPLEIAQTSLAAAELKAAETPLSAIQTLQDCIKSLESTVNDLDVKYNLPLKKLMVVKSTKKMPKAHSLTNEPVIIDLLATMRSRLATLYLQIDDAEQHTQFIDQLRPHATSGSNEVIHSLARAALIEAEDVLANDPVYNVIKESALSLPNICGLPAARKPAAGKTSQRKGHNTKEPGLTTRDQVRTLLKDSQDLVLTDLVRTMKMKNSHGVHAYCTLFATFAFVQAALSSPMEDSQTRSPNNSFFLEASRNFTFQHELDRKAAAKTVDEVPLRVDEILKKCNPAQALSAVAFYKDLVETLPPNWRVVSISLSNTSNELILTQLLAQKKPLTLRLPLSRHSSRDIDEDVFQFHDAVSELHDIIHASDLSAQAAKDIKDKKSKQGWWTQRQDLDVRLKTLLDNIERCWLGGFRGLLNNTVGNTDNDLFGIAFAKIINKHVSLKKGSQFDLDVRLLDLFTSVGTVSEEESLEVLEDLLYFVLDIYQFHGESVAYDEIDIDQMTVDMQAALKAHHERQPRPPADSHTILILDKNLHQFPWESMSCIKGQSISRIPSLPALGHILKQYRDQNTPQVRRIGGRFVLNPSLDLKTTETTFRKQFESLPEWSGIVARKPEEAELLEFLQDAPVYMYFGHGGGEQYIRANKLKQLPKCAVAFLMGCSSGALKDQGIYEPWGLPYDYLIAGSPCVVANLWDVTDKDIDKFSTETLERWSLLGNRPNRESLPSAVANSRDQCFLRYLNGAAPVVYGIPVWLENR